MTLFIHATAACLLLAVAAGAQDPSKPTLRTGVSVRMPVSEHAVEMRAADEENATVIAITAEGKIYNGITPVELGALSLLPAETVYVKADARVPFQSVLAVLGALRGKAVGLLVAAPASVPKREIMPPYGILLHR